MCVCLHIPAYYDTCVEVRGTMKSVLWDWGWVGAWVDDGNTRLLPLA